MTANTEMIHRYLREAITDISNVIDESGHVEYGLIEIKRKLIQAEYHFARQYLAYLAERANIDIDPVKTNDTKVYVCKACNDGGCRLSILRYGSVPSQCPYGPCGIGDSSDWKLEIKK